MNVSDLLATNSATINKQNNKKEPHDSFENYLYNAEDKPKEEVKEPSPQEITQKLLEQLIEGLRKNIYMSEQLQKLLKKLKEFMKKMSEGKVTDSEIRAFLKSFNELYEKAIEDLGNAATTISKEQTKKENKPQEDNLPIEDLKKLQVNIQETIRELEGKNNFENSIKKQSLKTEELVLANDIKGMIIL